ncbi:MAG: gamma-glutamyltransferase [Polyangiaceae bacterium]
MPRQGVVAEHPEVARVALEILKSGGTAADAAVAAMFLAGVVQSVSSGLGGGGFAIHYDAKHKKTTVIDFRETAPVGLVPGTIDRLTAKRRGTLVGAPGELAGLAELHRRWGSKPFNSLIEPAISAARNGFSISQHARRTAKASLPLVAGSAHAARFVAPLATASRARNTTVATTLEQIQREGIAAMYGGSIGQSIVTAARASGSSLTLDDLARYQVVTREPLELSYGGLRILTLPAPSAGGLLLAQTLLMHSPDSLRQIGYGTGSYYHLLAETFRTSLVDRIRHIGDPAYSKTPLEMLLSPSRLGKRRASIALDRTRAEPWFEIGDGGTSHFSAIDRNGNAIAVTSSLGHMFGAKLFTSTGFPLNDALTGFSTAQLLRRYHPRRKGPNRPVGGARPVSSMTPTLVLDARGVRMLLGGTGGSRAATGVTQVFLAQEVFGLTPEQAIRDARIHTPAGGGLRIDPDAPQGLRDNLRERGERLLDTLPNYGSVSVIRIAEQNGALTIDMATDPRKGGAALAH